MRKTFAIVTIVLLTLILFCGLVGCSEEQTADTLTVYNWADYIYDYEEEFCTYYKEKTGRDITVTYVTFDTNETMLTKVLKGDSQVDVICPSEYAIQKLLEADMLEELNYFTDSNYLNSKYVNSGIVSKIKTAFDGFTVGGKAVDITKYLVPYMYGTLGVLYNVDVMSENGISESQIYDAGWGVLFNTDKDGNKLSTALDNRIFMKESRRDTYVATICYLYERGMFIDTPYQDVAITKLINTVDETLIEMVRSTLITQKEILYGYEVDFGKNDLIAGTAYVDLAWSGDALYAMEEAEEYGVTLNYFAPESGGNIWFDGWVMLKNAKNKEAAKLFIDFLNSPYCAAQNMCEIGYSSAVDPQAIRESQDAMAVLYDCYEVDSSNPTEVAEFEDYFFNQVRYPDLNNPTLGVMKDFGANNQMVVMMWEGVRSTGITAWALLGWTMLALGVVVGIIAVVYVIRDYKRKYVVIK